jgi:chlorobactene glucosyltransferase
MHFLISYYFDFVILLTLPICIIAIVNLFEFRKPKAIVSTNISLPFISILVPARNEERVIEKCIESLLAQNYPNFEVLVLDDNSSDSTYEELCILRNRDYRLRILAGALLPDGWCGKPHACWQLAKAASGEFLLFTDADCVFHPDALLLAVGAMAEHEADLVSLSPEYVSESFWEELLVSQLVYIPLYFAPMPLVNGSSYSFIGGANGSFLYMKKSTYFEVDGHHAVRGELAEDIKFAQMVKRKNKHFWYGDGINAYSVRMYESLGQIWVGFTRNLFPAFSNKLYYLIPTLFYLLMIFVLPLILGIYGFMQGASWTWLAFTPYLITILLRLSICLKLKRGHAAYVLLDPLAWSATIIIAIGSVFKTKFSGAEWKGRTYINGRLRESDN